MITCRSATPPALALAACLVLAACGASNSVPAAGQGDVRAAPATVAVVASTDVYGSVVSAVGADAVEVTSIINNPDADPHEYESKPADAVAINRAKLVVYNGAGYDPFVEQLLEAAGTKPTVINVSDLSGLEAAVPADKEFNEHLWYSLPTMKKLADAIAVDLSTADPTSASLFTANAHAFDVKIDGLVAKLDGIKATHGGQKVAITEPVPLYMIEAAGLVNVTPEKFSATVEEGSDAPAAVVAETLAVFEGPGKAKALLANTQTPDVATKQVADAATANKVPIVQVSETLPAGVSDYVGWMSQQIDALGAALDQPA